MQTKTFLNLVDEAIKKTPGQMGNILAFLQDQIEKNPSLLSQVIRLAYEKAIEELNNATWNRALMKPVNED